jgi:anti-sigma regulatory factor (Ser/Thr protein kinase)
MNERLTVTLKNDLSELERVSRLVDEFGTRHCLPARAIFELTLALDEILTNVLSYGFDDGGEHEIVVRLTPPESGGTAGVTVEVEDDGRPFDPLQVRAPDVHSPLEERQVGGLGIYLARTVMDRLEYRRQGGKNVLVMRKNVCG